MKTFTIKKPIYYFLSAQTISLLGSSLVQYAIVWYITLSTSSGMMLTISTVCGFLPQILISPIAGIWLDKYNKKILLMLSDSFIAVSTLLLAILFISGHKNIYLLFLVLAIRSAGTGIQTPAVNSILPTLVEPAKLMKFNGIYSTLTSMMMFLSPALSALILSFASFEATLFIDVITAVIGVGITAFIPIRFIGTQKKLPHSGISELKIGLNYILHNKFIKRLFTYQLILLILISPSAFLTPLMISRRFGPDIWRLSISEMSYSLGMVLGGILIASWGGFKKRLHTTLLSGILYGICMLGLGNAPLFGFYLLCNTLIGITAPCYNTPITTSLQEKTTPDMHGRVFSFMQIASSSALPFGMLIFGPLADVIPIGILFTGCGLCVIALSYTLYKFRCFE